MITLNSSDTLAGGIWLTRRPLTSTILSWAFSLRSRAATLSGAWWKINNVINSFTIQRQKLKLWKTKLPSYIICKDWKIRWLYRDQILGFSEQIIAIIWFCSLNWSKQVSLSLDDLSFNFCELLSQIYLLSRAMYII